MLIVGTGGLAKDVIASMEQDVGALVQDVCFFDNINNNSSKLFDHYHVYHSFDQLEILFTSEKKDFLVCIGNPLLRKRLADKLKQLGGKLTQYVSQKTCAISPITAISPGVFVQQGCIISRNATVEEGVFMNASCIIGHDAILHEYVSLGPGVKILGGAEIGAFSYIGCNAVIMPGVKIGKKVRIGVGKIIDKDVPDNAKIM